MLIRHRLYAALYALSDAERELCRALEPEDRSTDVIIAELCNRLQELQERIEQLLTKPAEGITC